MHLRGFQARGLKDLLIPGRVRVIQGPSLEVIRVRRGHPCHDVPSVESCIGVSADQVQTLSIHVVGQAILCVIAPQYRVEVVPSHQGR